MRDIDARNNLNILKSIAEFGKSAPNFNGETHFRFGKDEEAVLFKGETNCNKLDEIIDKLFESNKEISFHYPLEDFRFEIINLIKTANIETREVSVEDWSNLINKLIAVPITQHEIFIKIFGVKTNVPIVEFGDFTIYNLELAHHSLISQYEYLKRKDNKDFFDNNYLLSVKIKLRHKDKADLFARDYFEKFENVINYMLADISRRRRVGIFNFREPRQIQTFICTDSVGGYNTLNDELYEPTDLAQPYFNSSEYGNDKIWKLIVKPDKSDIEKRLMIAIEWIGKAVLELDKSKSLVQYVFAIEALLQYNDGAFVSASIVSQLSDAAAFIISDNLEGRKKIAKQIKVIYQNRSAIAHGGNKITSDTVLEDVFRICHLLIYILLTNPLLSDFDTAAKLNEWIITQKFS